ncbi:hypothetical protein MAPG_00035 [Magnaporthiopsis poae ATCC 64411]|uniref:Uncharacterized protein n=1 Tax=Magnaporthiopsis poae (strain ATCC 64411 / 73-15) TaxID=644358 RepID=A0A0C4DJX6_MAGP6|nr:hypothetical protein MAPG_00035 [Magnaporthiopsis poae ATCC 64411]
MREAHVRMCTIELGLRNLPGKLRLESSLTLALPDSWNQEDTTADSLAIAAIAGNLWVERASPCHLGVQVTISGGTLAEEARSEGRIVEAIRRCSAWDLLGIQLSRSQRPSQETNGDPQAPGALFYISHKSKASGHLSCHYAPRAQLRQLECRFDFDFAAPDKPKARRTAPAPPPRPKKRRSSARVTRPMARDTEEGSLEAALKPRQPELPTATVDQSVGILTRASLYTLLGIKKRTPRAVMLRPFQSSTLLDIAPAVWNMWYLQSIIDHAPSLQRITSVLGRLATNAQSSSLRHRVGQLGESSPQGEGRDNEPNGQLAATPDTSAPVTDITDHIGQKLWPILQSSISFRKTPRSLASSNTIAPEPEDPSPERLEYGNQSEASVDDYQAEEADSNDYGIYHDWQDAEEPGQNDIIDEDEPHWYPEDSIEADGSMWEPGGYLYYYNQRPEAPSQIDWAHDEAAIEEDQNEEYDDPGSWSSGWLAEELPAPGELSWE